MLRLFPIIVFLLCLTVSCSDRETERIIDAAASLFEERPDSAYYLLKTIDADALPIGSELQARYALLFTQAQYKNYEDAANDSLISLAADYYEMNGSTEEKFYAYLYQGIVRYLLHDEYNSSVALFRAMLNSEDVDDHYSKGQMYVHLSMINSLLNCNDEEKYAQMAAEEYQKGDLLAYSLDALNKVAEARFRNNLAESCQTLLDSILPLAESTGISKLISDNLKLQASVASAARKYEKVSEIYTQLRRDFNIQLNYVEYGNLAINASLQGDDAIRCYLDSAKNLLRTRNDTILFLAKSLRAYGNTGNTEMIIAIQDSLIGYCEELITQYKVHTNISVQKDYSEWKAQLAEERYQQVVLLLVLSIACLILCIFAFVLHYINRKTRIESQAAKIKLLQMELQMNIRERTDALENIKNERIVRELKLNNVRSTGLSIAEWREIENLVHENLPHFEPSLRKLVNLSDFELQVCFLLKLDFQPSQIAVLTNHSATSVSTTRSRLYYKAYHKKGSSSDWDTLVASI